MSIEDIMAQIVNDKNTVREISKQLIDSEEKWRTTQIENGYDVSYIDDRIIKLESFKHGDNLHGLLTYIKGPFAFSCGSEEDGYDEWILEKFKNV
jgi:hypothetical protein